MEPVNIDMRMSSSFVMYLIPNYGLKMCLVGETSDTQATFGRERVKARGFLVVKGMLGPFLR